MEGGVLKDNRVLHLAAHGESVPHHSPLEGERSEKRGHEKPCVPLPLQCCHLTALKPAGSWAISLASPLANVQQKCCRLCYGFLGVTGALRLWLGTEQGLLSEWGWVGSGAAFVPLLFLPSDVGCGNWVGSPGHANVVYSQLGQGRASFFLTCGSPTSAKILPIS